jgi:hypothetical protein
MYVFHEIAMSLLQSKKDLSRNIIVNGRNMYVDRSTGCRNFSGLHTRL